VFALRDLNLGCSQKRTCSHRVRMFALLPLAPAADRHPIGHAAVAGRCCNGPVTAIAAGIFLLRVPPQHEIPLRSRGAGGSPNRSGVSDDPQLNKVADGGRRAPWKRFRGFARSEGRLSECLSEGRMNPKRSHEPPLVREVVKRREPDSGDVDMIVMPADAPPRGGMRIRGSFALRMRGSNTR
jgi:hypothetical protein